MQGDLGFLTLLVESVRAVGIFQKVPEHMLDLTCSQHQIRNTVEQCSL